MPPVIRSMHRKHATTGSPGSNSTASCTLVVDAFKLVAPDVRTCTRTGYLHIHGPNQTPGTGRCATHSIVVEQANGTVSLRTPIAKQLGFTKRPNAPISQHPLGYSNGPDYGVFDYALSFEDILDIWGHLVTFAITVIAAERAAGRWT